MNRKLLLLLTVIGVIASSLIPAVNAQENEDGERKVEYWVAPMDPNFRRNEPGKSPMGMDLVPVYADELEGGSSVRISPELVQSLGVRTQAAEHSRLWRRIDTVGYVNYDESMLAHIHLRTSGWIENLQIRSIGERVSKGDLLFDLYSPELVNVQEEYVQALNSGRERLISASRQRLLAMGIGAGTAEELASSRQVLQSVPIFAPQDGVVSDLSVREGMFVQPSLRTMALADQSSVWLLAEVFERQADWVREGQPAEVQLAYRPGETWEGTVEYIYPDLDPQTRALKVRLRFDNPGEVLKPNMYAQVRIFGGGTESGTIIPLEALIRTGHEERVIIALGEGRFEARTVRIGIESGDWVQILAGVEAGELVVTSAQFLIDSESSLKASMLRMSSSGNAQ